MKRAVKTLIVGAMLGRPSYWSHAARRGAMQVLCYHRISEAPDPLGLAVSEAEFEWQMRTLATSRFVRPVSATEFLGLWPGRRDRGARIPVLVSFDDGFEDNLTLALPILEHHGVPAILFVATDVLAGQPPWYDLVECLVSGGHGPALRGVLMNLGFMHAADEPPPGAAAWVDRLLALPGAQFDAVIDAIRALPAPAPLASRYLSPPGLREWVARGMEVGAHSCSHARLSALAPERAAWEMAESKRQLEALLGRPVNCFAYPFGRRDDFTPAQARAAAGLGYAMAFTTMQGINLAGHDPYVVRRKCVSSGLFTQPDGSFSEALFLADLMGLGAELKRSVFGPWRHGRPLLAVEA